SGSFSFGQTVPRRNTRPAPIPAGNARGASWERVATAPVTITRMLPPASHSGVTEESRGHTPPDDPLGQDAIYRIARCRIGEHRSVSGAGVDPGRSPRREGGRENPAAGGRSGPSAASLRAPRARASLRSAPEPGGRG